MCTSCTSTPAAAWVDNDLTAFAKGTPAVSGSALASYWGSDNSQHVNFIGTDGHVHELYIHPGAGWVDNDLTAFAKGALPAPGSALDGYWGSDNSQHVNFISTDGHVHELYIHPGALVGSTTTLPLSPGASPPHRVVSLTATGAVTAASTSTS